MNRFKTTDPAKIQYLDNDFNVISQGSYVVCAITGQHIPVDELKYWNVERQEAYADVQASYASEIKNKSYPI